MTIHAHDVASTESLMPRQLLQEGDFKVTALAGHHGDAPAVIYRIDHAGKSITFSGDIDAQGLPALQVIAAGTDLLVFNCVVLDPPGSPAILYTLHTPPHAIGLLAKEVGARALLLSHISPAVEEMKSAVAASIRQNYPASTEFARDGMRLRP